MADKILQDLHVLITRPADQAQNLAHLIKEKGAESFLLPTIEIKAIKNVIWDSTQSYDFAIFTSQNAVIHSYDALAKTNRGKIKHMLAMGEGTERKLKHYGFAVTATAEQPFGSESLLRLPLLQHCAGKKIIIFSGKCSRDLLMTVLKERQAEVALVEVYERIIPSYPAKTIESFFQQNKIDIIVTTSNASLNNLIAIFSALRHTIENIPHLVVSERGYQLAKSLKIKKVLRTKSASDAAIMECLIDYVTFSHVNLSESRRSKKED